jgi:hypothetical protein
MLRFFARHWARTQYMFRQETEADTNDLNAGLALRIAAEKHKLGSGLRLGSCLWGQDDG